MIRSLTGILAALMLVSVAGGCAGLATGAGPSAGLPADKQVRADKYASDAAAGQSNQQARVVDPAPPSDDPNDTPKSGFPTKAGGDGTIVDTGNSGPPGTQDFIWQNEWYVKTPTQVISVYAGARKVSPSQGVLLVSVWTPDESKLVRSMLIDTPRAAGSVRFVSGKGKIASLQATDGTSFSFDASALSVH